MPADPNLTADLLWLQTCYYFGDQATSNQRYGYLDDYLEMIIALAPRWKRPYYFAATIFPLEVGDVDTGLGFLEQAIEQFPQEWQFWFFKGIFLMLEKNELIAAGRALHKAALLPGSPRYLSRLSATLATKAGQKELARRFLQEALDNTDDPEQRRIILQKFEDMLNDEYDLEMG